MQQPKLIMNTNHHNKLKDEQFYFDINSESNPISTKNIPMISKNGLLNGCGKTLCEDSLMTL